MKTRYLLLSSLFTLNLAACQPADLPTGANSPLTPATDVGQAGTNVSLRLVTARGMSIQTLPGQNRVHKYVVTVKKGATVVGAPKDVTLELANLGTFNVTMPGVEAGTGYTVEVDAVDAAGASVLVAKGVSATFAVANGVANNGLPLTIDIAFVAGTPGTADGPLVTLNATSLLGIGLMNPDKVGIALVNDGNHRSTTVGAAADLRPTASNATPHTKSYALRNVQQGSVLSNSYSHGLWTYFVNGTTGKATLPQMDMLDASTTALERGTILSGTKDITPKVRTLSPSNGVGIAPTDGRLIPTASSALYYVEGGNLKKYNSVVPAILESASGVPLTVSTATATINGQIYFYDSTTKKIIRVLSWTGNQIDKSVEVLSLGGAAISHLNVDVSGCLYWIHDGKIKKLSPGAASESTPTALGAVTGVTQLAVDHYGNIYYVTDGTHIYKAALGDNEVTYTVQTEVTPGAAFSDMTVDRAGNVYFVQANELKLHANGNPAATVYTVDGLSTVQVASPVMYGDTLFFRDTTAGPNVNSPKMFGVPVP